MEISSELFTTFNSVTYHDEPHKYYVDGKELISVTTLIHQYQEKFDEEYWSDIKSNEYLIDNYLIKRGWNFINKKGTLKGSIIHDYAENLFQNKIFKYPKDEIINTFGFDPIWDEYVITKKHVDKFYSDSYGKLIPIRTEFVVYDKESLIGGMLDALFYNVKYNEIQIFDWKTNKNFTKSCKNKHLLNELEFIEDCDLNIYSLQLSLYKYIIEKNTNIKLGKSYIVWFSHNNPSYEIIEVKDMSFYVKKIIQNRIN